MNGTTAALSIAEIGESVAGCFDLSVPVDYEVPVSFDVPLGGVVNATEGITGVGPFSYNSHTINITGGSIPYNYNWDMDGYVLTNILSNNMLEIIYEDGAYWSVTITDNNNCSDEELIFASTPTSPTDPLSLLEITDYTTVSASQSNADGAITVEVSGGDGAPYNYYWFGGSMNVTMLDQGSSVTLTDLYSGWYSLEVEDPSTGQTTLGWFWVSEGNNSGGVRGKTSLGFSANIAPNPLTTHTTVQVYVPETAAYQIAIYDLNGRKIKQVFDGNLEANTSSNFEITSEQLSNGLYLLEMRNSLGQRQIEELVVIE